MLKKSEWMMDKRPLRDFKRTHIKSWEEWIDAHPRSREQWLMSIIDYLLKNQNWSGGYLLIRSYIATLKVKEGNKTYNRNPWDESPHVRAVRLWFFALVEKYGFAAEEEFKPPVPYEETDNTLIRRRKIEQKANEIFPFVGGKPKRRYSETVDFFEQVANERYDTHNRSKKKPTLEEDQ